MNFKPYSIYSEDQSAMYSHRAKDYSNDQYDGVCCGYDRTQCPVVIMHSKRQDPLNWKVVYGFCTVFFETFQEAMDFCRSHDMTILKDNEDSRRD